MLHIRLMTSADVPLGMRLKAQANWNQTLSDWRRFLDLEPDGCFVAEQDGEPVGTTTTCVFDTVAWIAMVLVDTAARGQGIGTRLVDHALAELDRRGIQSVRLDATALGRPIYENLGFVAQYELLRMEGTTWQVDRSPTNAAPVTRARLDEVIALDALATGTDRRRLLERLYHEQPERMLAICDDRGKIAGYAAFRDGSRATQIGPAAAKSPEAGRALLDTVVARLAGQPIFVDIPSENQAAVGWATSGGLTVQRPFTRMCRGQPTHDRRDVLWASSGPEKG